MSDDPERDDDLQLGLADAYDRLLGREGCPERLDSAEVAIAAQVLELFQRRPELSAGFTRHLHGPQRKIAPGQRRTSEDVSEDERYEAYFDNSEAD